MEISEVQKADDMQEKHETDVDVVWTVGSVDVQDDGRCGRCDVAGRRRARIARASKAVVDAWMPKKVEIRNRFEMFDGGEIHEGDDGELIASIEDQCGLCGDGQGAAMTEQHCGGCRDGHGIFGVKDASTTVEVTVDSGASKSVWPRSMRGVRRKKLEQTPRLVAANGTEIQVDGEAILGFRRDGKKCEMRFWDAEVKKPLGAVSAIVDEGNTVIFSKKKSFIRNDETGEEIVMKRKGGTYVIELNAEEALWQRNVETLAEVRTLEKKEDEEEMELARLIKERYGEGEVVFRRRVR